MSYAGFASLVDAPASSRSSRLLFASAIACSSLAFALSVAFTLERMSILRMPGPKTRYELAAVAIAEPPKIVEPPDKPEEVAAAGSQHDDAQAIAPPPSTILETGEDDRSEPDIGSDTSGPPGIPGIPGGGAACLGGVCGKGPIGILGGGGSCIGPQCKQVTVKKPSAPKPVPVSSLGCIACADPDLDALRRTAAGMRKSGGTNTTRFCVDSTGRVEAGSVETETSHGDPAIDRVCRDAVKRWRFSPAKVSGEGRRACSEATFRIDFE